MRTMRIVRGLIDYQEHVIEREARRHIRDRRIPIIGVYSIVKVGLSWYVVDDKFLPLRSCSMRTTAVKRCFELHANEGRRGGACS